MLPYHWTTKSCLNYHLGCVTCRHTMAKPQSHLIGQLPIERVTPGSVFEHTGNDYAGPVYVKLGHVRKPIFVKAYIGIFISLSVKAVHIELISDLTSAAFLACLRCFVARRGKPIKMWSDHGSNFVGTSRELKDLAIFLEKQKESGEVSDFCTSQGIEWSFVPERAPHFGGLWESVVKSVKTHLKRVLGEARLTFEEFSTVLAQVEACLNSRPLVPLDSNDDGIEALTLGNFLAGRLLEALPDPPSTLILCQSLIFVDGTYARHSLSISGRGGLLTTSWVYVYLLSGTLRLLSGTLRLLTWRLIILSCWRRMVWYPRSGLSAESLLYTKERTIVFMLCQSRQDLEHTKDRLWR